MDRPRAVAADTRERSCSPRRSPARRSPRLVAAPHPRAIFPRARRRNVSPRGEKDRGNVPRPWCVLGQYPSEGTFSANLGEHSLISLL
ncbi:hypothetical protein GW17_00004043 [Ensete ventricosum]|nr:hypothetical protein GW17_00004043 [Ensete ventricosum]